MSILWTLYGRLQIREMYSAVNTWIGQTDLGYSPKLFKGNRDLDTIWCLGCVKVDIRSLGCRRHGVDEMFGQLFDTWKHI